MFTKKNDIVWSSEENSQWEIVEELFHLKTNSHELSTWKTEVHTPPQSDNIEASFSYDFRILPKTIIEIHLLMSPQSEIKFSLHNYNIPAEKKYIGSVDPDLCFYRFTLNVASAPVKDKKCIIIIKVKNINNKTFYIPQNTHKGKAAQTYTLYYNCRRVSSIGVSFLVILFLIYSVIHVTLTHFKIFTGFSEELQTISIMMGMFGLGGVVGSIKMLPWINSLFQSLMQTKIMLILIIVCGAIIPLTFLEARMTYYKYVKTKYETLINKGGFKNYINAFKLLPDRLEAQILINGSLHNSRINSDDGRIDHKLVDRMIEALHPTVLNIAKRACPQKKFLYPNKQYRNPIFWYTVNCVTASDAKKYYEEFCKIIYEAIKNTTDATLKERYKIFLYVIKSDYLKGSESIKNRRLIKKILEENIIQAEKWNHHIVQEAWDKLAQGAMFSDPPKVKKAAEYYLKVYHHRDISLKHIDLPWLREPKKLWFYHLCIANAKSDVISTIKDAQDDLNSVDKNNKSLKNYLIDPYEQRFKELGKVQYWRQGTFIDSKWNKKNKSLLISENLKTGWKDGLIYEK